MPPYLANLNAGTANYNQATQPPLLFPPQHGFQGTRRRSTLLRLWWETVVLTIISRREA